jgi:5-methylcytosine-specific restriction endonuclease McrA
VLHRALTLLVERLRKQKFAATHQPRPRRKSPGPETRHVPAEVKRAVWKRDGGRCTFVSEKGHRCESRRVEFDHVLELARGGRATVSGIRLRCRAHNQYTAERTFGVEFMRHKRERSRRQAMAARAPG